MTKSDFLIDELIPASQEFLIPTVKRRSRLTSGQHAALTKFWPEFGIALPAHKVLTSATLFGNNAPLILDIGFGDGTATAEMAGANPDSNVIGVELFQPGIALLCAGLAERGLVNVKIANSDLRMVLPQIPLGELAEIRVYFPDPWPKKRHHKRRLLQPELIQQLGMRLQIGGRLHIATDWTPYALELTEALTAESCLLFPAQQPASLRPSTRFERRAHQAGRPVTDLLAIRIAN